MEAVSGKVALREALNTVLCHLRANEPVGEARRAMEAYVAAWDKENPGVMDQILSDCGLGFLVAVTPDTPAGILPLPADGE